MTYNAEASRWREIAEDAQSENRDLKKHLCSDKCFHNVIQVLRCENDRLLKAMKIKAAIKTQNAIMILQDYGLLFFGEDFIREGGD